MVILAGFSLSVSENSWKGGQLQGRYVKMHESAQSVAYTGTVAVMS